MIDKINEIADAADKSTNIFERILDNIPSFRANKLLMKEIENDPDMSPTDKAAYLYALKDLKKSIKNLATTYNLTDFMLKTKKGTGIETSLSQVNDEWLGMYNDIVKNISDENMQLIWAKILASKCEDSDSVGKRLLSILQIIDNQTAEAFSYLCSHTFMLCDNGEKTKPFFLYHIGSVGDSSNDLFPSYSYDQTFLNAHNITELDSIGLIRYENFNGFNLKINEIELDYFGSKLSIKSKNSISIGYIIYTSCGEQLINALYDKSTDKDMNFFNHIAEYYRRSHCIVNIH